MSNAFDGKSGLVMNSGPSIPTNTTAELEERIDRMRFDAAKAEHDRKQAELKAKVGAGVEVSLQGNAQLQAQRMGIGSGQALNEAQAKTRDAMTASSNAIAAPKALIDTLPVTIGGIQLGPKQAQDMLARGEIGQADYTAAVNAAVAPYGYSSFR